MDYRRRRYYAVRLYHYKEELELLKKAAPSLKVLEPYNHFKYRSNNHKFKDYSQDHDCNAIGKYIQIVVSCLIEESENFEKRFDDIPVIIIGYDNFSYSNHRCLIPLHKYNLGQ